MCKKNKKSTSGGDEKPPESNECSYWKRKKEEEYSYIKTAFGKKDQKPDDVRSDLYSFITAIYIFNLSESMKTKRKMKSFLFVFIVGILSVVLIVFVRTTNEVLEICKSGQGDAVFKAVSIELLTSFATLVTSILTLPRIIAKYLFHAKEERSAVDIIANIQNYDVNVLREDTKKEQIDMQRMRPEMGNPYQPPDPNKPDGGGESSAELSEIKDEDSSPENL